MARGDDQARIRLDGGGHLNGVRFPDGLRDRLKQAASANNRSMNAEIVHRLEASFATGPSLHAEVAATLDRHIAADVEARLRRVAAQIGGA